MYQNMKKKYFITVVLIILVLLIYFLAKEQPLYGNDKKSIKQVINSIEGYENQSIEILEIKDIKNERFVGFLINNDPAYIEFSKNEDEKYRWRYVERSSGENFSIFSVHAHNTNNLRFMIVTNQDNNVAKLELGVNNKVIEKEFPVNQKVISWITLPPTKDNQYTFTYKYLDKDGNPIEF